MQQDEDYSSEDIDDETSSVSGDDESNIVDTVASSKAASQINIVNELEGKWE